MAKPIDHSERPLAQPPPPPEKSAHVKRPPPRPARLHGSAAAPVEAEIVEAEIVEATLVSATAAPMSAITPPPISSSARIPRRIALAAAGFHPVWYALTGFALVLMLGLLVFVGRKQFQDGTVLVGDSPDPSSTATALPLPALEAAKTESELTPSSPRPIATGSGTPGTGSTINPAAKPAMSKAVAIPTPAVRGPVPKVAEDDNKRRDVAIALLETRGLKRTGRTWVLTDEAKCLNLLDTARQAETRHHTAKIADSYAKNWLESQENALEREKSNLQRLDTTRKHSKELREKRNERMADRRESVKTAEDKAAVAKRNLEDAARRVTDTWTEARRLADAVEQRYRKLAADAEVRRALDDLGQQLGPSEEFRTTRIELRREPRL